MDTAHFPLFPPNITHIRRVVSNSLSLKIFGDIREMAAQNRKQPLVVSSGVTIPGILPAIH